ncbi:FAD/NAD(P)-binding protein [Salinarimonas ramus]|uniref:FAD-dependent urate hydroxylase HpyO/Asp monooxygenase CreE-like FAD/NAD(P)-binding domain-containing protein n=1 Tax=Salinarimonas ramus TaxID=690164 RepID=A0A917V3T7_9HYPH|nr:FAD/NAD(P)-binding domain-containing protein [Salinarimonas ramus]GGK32549.1 hypothetical protein GCM10011322_19070 [Salinarimonas ramus]
MTRLAIAIVGAGPWGLAVLDRVIARARAHPATRFDVVLVDPREPGPGLHDPEQEPHLILNTVAGQIDAFGARHFGEPPLRGALPFLDWARREIDPAIGANVFLPRRHYGAYLRFVHEVLRDNLPANTRLHRHRSVAIGLEPLPGGGFALRLEDGERPSADHVFVCTGHGLAERAAAEPDDATIPPYPVARLQEAVAPGTAVGVAGMGLVAVDVVASLTEGRGGVFEETPEGTLSYRPSGLEPTIFAFSRTGTPFACRPSSTLDLATIYTPIFCRSEAIARGDGLDFDADLLPLLTAELWAAFAMRRALLDLGEEAQAALRARFARLSPADAVDLAREALRPGESFDPRALIVGDRPRRYPHATAFREAFRMRLAYDVAEAREGEAASPYKHAVEMLRVLRDFIRDHVRPDRLAPASHRRFFRTVAPRISGLVVGPPLSRGREWLALIEAGIVRVDLGPAPELSRDYDTGAVVARSTALDAPATVQLDAVVRARVDTAPTDPVVSPLCAQLHRSGLCPLNGGTATGYLRVDSTGQPIDATGLPVPGLSVLGVPTEGATYFNHYLPSPRSRARAFETADAALAQALSRQWGDEAARYPGAA